MSVSPAPGRLFILPSTRMRALRRIATGGLRVLPDGDDMTAPFHLIDNADGEITQGDRLLLWRDGRIECFDATGIVSCAPNAHTPDFPDALDSTLRRAVGDVSSLRRLLPIGGGMVSHQTLRFVDDDRKTHARLSAWCLTADGGGRALVVQLRPLRGYDRTARRIEEGIVALGAAPLDAGALVARLFPKAPILPADTPVEFAADEPALSVARRLIAAQIATLRQNEAGIIADVDTEFLHDYRVALRRMRSIAGLFSGVIAPQRAAALKLRFAALMRPTGPLRDLDVRLIDAARFRAMVPPALHRGLDAMEELIAARRAVAQAELAEHLRTATYRREMRVLERLFAPQGGLRPGPNGGDPIGLLAARLIDKRRKRFARLARAIEPQTPDAAVHALRIEGKKLRYLLEFFAPLCDRQELAGLLRPLKQLQDILGRFNDASVQAEDLSAFTQAIDPARMEGAVEMAAAAGALHAALAIRQATERRALTDALAAFDHADVARRIRRLFPEGSPHP